MTNLQYYQEVEYDTNHAEESAWVEWESTDGADILDDPNATEREVEAAFDRWLRKERT